MTYEVVLIDDTPDIRLLLRIVLERSGHFRVVSEAGDGLGGIEAVARHTPDLVLLDLAMPLMNGLDALPRMRRKSPNSCFVIMSGIPGEVIEHRARQAGAHAYMQKGGTTSEIAPHLLDILEDFASTAIAS